MTKPTRAQVLKLIAPIGGERNWEVSSDRTHRELILACYIIPHGGSFQERVFYYARIQISQENYLDFKHSKNPQANRVVRAEVKQALRELIELIRYDHCGQDITGLYS